MACQVYLIDLPFRRCFLIREFRSNVDFCTLHNLWTWWIVTEVEFVKVGTFGILKSPILETLRIRLGALYRHGPIGQERSTFSSSSKTPY
jgi:hypothetical protein